MSGASKKSPKTENKQSAQAADLVRELNPKHVIPMHYRDDAAGIGYDVIGTVQTFTDIMTDVKMKEDSVYNMDAGCAEQVIVLRSQNA